MWRWLQHLLLAASLLYAGGWFLSHLGELLALDTRDCLAIAQLALAPLLLTRNAPRFVWVGIVVVVVGVYTDVVCISPVEPSDFAGKSVLVTGANSGIGYETSRILAASGARVILGCRSPKKCKQAKQDMQTWMSVVNSPGEVVVLESALDMASQQSIQQYAGEVTRYLGRSPDILINNAGFNPLPTDRPTVDGFESGFGSMHLGHFVLTKLLADYADGKGQHVHVVNVASGLHGICFFLDCFPDEWWSKGIQQGFYFASYPRAKFANVLHAWALPAHYENVTAASVDLGWVATGIQSWMKSGQLNPENLRMMRHGDVGVNPVLFAANPHNVRSANGGVVNTLSRVGLPGQLHPILTIGVNVYPSDEDLLKVRDDLWTRSERLLKAGSIASVPGAPARRQCTDDGDQQCAKKEL